MLSCHAFTSELMPLNNLFCQGVSIIVEDFNLSNVQRNIVLNEQLVDAMHVHDKSS